MALAKTRRGGGVTNYWPGYVDMLSTLLLVVTFLMSLFMLTNYFITTQTSGKDTMLSRLNRQLSELTELLALERSKKQSVEDSLSALQATLIDKDKENARLTGLLGDQSGKTEGAEAKSSELSGQLDQQKRITNEALAKVEILNQQLAALRLQLAELQEALDASEAKDKESQVKIADLGAAPERGARQEGAGARPLPLRFLRQAQGGARLPRQTSRWSATASCSRPTCCSIRARRI